MGGKRRRKRQVWVVHVRAAGRDGDVEGRNLGQLLQAAAFHIGSQVPDILTVKKAVQEATRIYAKLVKMGFAIEFMDVAAGWAWITTAAARPLTAHQLHASGYTTTRLLHRGRLQREKVAHPNLISESGRASSRITACWW